MDSAKNFGYKRYLYHDKEHYKEFFTPHIQYFNNNYQTDILSFVDSILEISLLNQRIFNAYSYIFDQYYSVEHNCNIVAKKG